jgi:FkbM family methyltransferase
LKFYPYSFNKEEKLDLTQVLLDSARHADFVFDLGANVGLITKKLLEAGCFVYAFEPDPEAFKLLIKINSPRLMVQNVAIWTNEGKTKLYRHRDWNLSKSHTSSSLISDKKNVNDANSVIVNTTDISDLVKSLKGTKLMKMDVEGAEYKILNYWSRNRLINQFSTIYCEFHGKKIKWGRVKHFFLYTQLIIRRQNHIVKEWY